MKTYLLVISACALVLSNSAYCQENTVPKVDDRVKLHYSDTQLKEIAFKAPYKIEQLNFMYASSFNIINQDGNKVKVDASKYDVYNYERFRKKDQRVVFRLSREGDALELLSRDELEIEMNKIQNNYK